MKTPIQSGGEAMPEDTRDIGDACDVLCRAIYLNEVLFMAGGSQSDRKLANAITTQCDFINDLLMDAKAILYANIEREGGAS